MVETSTLSSVSQLPDYSLCGRPPASIWVVLMMPLVKIMEEGRACVICLEEWRKGEDATELPCKHIYHFECVSKWLAIHATCPQCRYEMPLEVEQIAVSNVEASVSDDSDSDYSDYYSDSDPDVS